MKTETMTTKTMKAKLSKLYLSIASSALMLSLVACNTTEQASSQSLPTANGLTYPIIDTNQTLCYDTESRMATCPTKREATFGQDSQYQGIAPSYTDNGDGTISDNNTGLMWVGTTDTNGDGTITADDKMTYDEAQAYAKQLNLAGYDDWRVPTIKELYSLMMFDGQDPSSIASSGKVTLIPFIDSEVFEYNAGDTNSHERLIDGQYISSTKYVAGTMHTNAETIFGVNFTDGRIKGYENHDPHGQADGKTFYIQLVRGNTAYGNNALKDNGDGTISDTATGLTWQQADSGQDINTGMDFPSALNYCEGLTLAGRDDWRLPNVKELQSIVDYTRSPDTTNSAAISPLFKVSTITNEAGNSDYPNYWSSTTHANSASTGDGTAGAYVAFGRSLGNMNGWVDVHGAGAQRSDPKVGDPNQYPDGYGPQGDAQRIYNYVKCVTDGTAEFIQQPIVITRQADTFVLTGNEPNAMDKNPDTLARDNHNDGNDNNGNGNNTNGMPSNQANMPNQSNPLTMMDSNGDNQLSKTEVKGPLANDFDKLDTDGNGYLTETELDNAPRPQ